MLSLTNGGGSGTPLYPESALYAEMIARAVRDILRGAQPLVLRQAQSRVPGAQRRLDSAENALGWIFAERGNELLKRRCGDKPCQPDNGSREGPCRSWRPRQACLRVW